MSQQKRAQFAAAYERAWKNSVATRPQSAQPTHGQIVAAAWGNVAAENPKVTLGDARRAIKKDRS